MAMEKSGSKDRMHPLLFWTFAVLGLTAARVPYFLSPNRLLDGDEAVLGLMAMHTSTLSGFPLFYWGQAYGFSLPETVAAAMAYRLFGVSSLTLSAGVFALFLLGLWLFEGGFRNLAGDRGWSRAIVLALGLLPAWIVWGFKARGGYLTAFVLAGLILRLVTARVFSRGRAVVAGLSVGLLFFAQPLWFAAFLPLLAMPFLPGAAESSWAEKVRLAALMLVSSLAAAAPIAIASSRHDSFWVPDVLGGATLHNLPLIPEALFTSFTGFFYLGESWRPPLVVWAVAMACLLACAVAVPALGASCVRRRNGRTGLVALSLLASASVAFILADLPPRYLLQVSVILATATAVWIGGQNAPFLRAQRAAAGIILLFLAAAAVSMASFRPHHPTSDNDLEEEMAELIAVLDGEGVEGVYSMDALLQWQILFYGGEGIPARFASPVDRRPEYPRAVDEALAEGKTTALVGTMLQAEPILDTPLGHTLRPVGENYFVLLDPSRAFLDSIGFRFRGGPP